MNRIILPFFLLLANLTFAQTKIVFNYDSAGNQIKRYICVGCPFRVSQDTIKKIEDLTENDLLQDEETKILYYPNPVKEELYVKWANVKENFVDHIEIYSLSGQLVKQLPNLKNLETINISFQSLPEGFYNLMLVYSNGDKKTLKIVKK